MPPRKRRGGSAAAGEDGGVAEANGAKALKAEGASETAADGGTGRVQTADGDAVRALLPAALRTSADDVAAFYRFVHARQEMWRRRQSGDSPWTTDALLAYYKFCNIYRELDRGTVYFRGSVERRKRVLPAAGAHLLRDVLWGSLVYRLLNRMESFQSWKEGGGLPNEHEWPCFLEYLAAQRAEGRVIFSNAHQTMGFDRYASTMAKVRKTLQKLTDAVWAARSSAERVFKILLRYENVGPFFAWQVTCDLLETAGVLDCDEDDWCQLGPGALRGLKRVFAHAPPATCAVNLDRARLLTSLHSAAFIALDCSFSYVGDRRLTLKNIEHALCEFEKYRNNMIGGRRFVSREACDGGAVCTKCRDETVEHDDVLLLCDLCGTAQHTFCLRPKLEALPEAEWFCAPCRAQWDARP
mmetsp:Transcript_9731/g.33628  ORF Transcript_9731/g.33628 Transcript_9731/m.33628 type:complete len:412 (+) Transcript_9731:68-1303(+)